MQILIILITIGIYMLTLYVTDVLSGVLGRRSREIQKAGLDEESLQHKTASRLHGIFSNPAFTYLWIPNRIKAFDKSAKCMGVKEKYGSRIYTLIASLILVIVFRAISSIIRNGPDPKTFIINILLIIAAISLPDILMKRAAKDYEEKLVEGLADVLELIFANTSTGFSSREIIDAAVNTLYDSPIKILLTELNNDLKLNTPYEQVFGKFNSRVNDERLVNFGVILQEALENDNNIADYTQKESEMLREIRRHSLQKKQSMRLTILLINGGAATLTFMFIIMVPFILRSLSIFIEIGGLK